MLWRNFVPQELVDDRPEFFLKKFNEIVVRVDEQDKEPEVVEELPEESSKDDGKPKPEWMERFKKIGMKGHEVITEYQAPDENLPPPPPKKEVATPHSFFLRR